MNKFQILLGILLGLAASGAPAADKHHALAMHGEPKYGPDFSHFDYANPDAPVGGTLRRHVIGTYDTFNPFISRGTAAAGISLLYDTLTTPSRDEPFTQYGLLAERIEMPEDRSWVIYHLRDEARFADGEPVTAEDVVFSFNLLVEKGAPFYSFYYADVEKVEALDRQRVRYTFAEGDNRELALIVGQMQVLPKHFWEERDFTQSSLDYPLGSGPYRMASHDTGKRVVYERRDDYWGKDLAVNRGHYNFGQVRFEYFLDDTVALEAFKGGRYDLRNENTASNWASGYQGPALERGEIIKEEIPHSLPAGMQGFVFNLRRPVFQDRQLRRAMTYAYDFEWANQNLFHGQYRRTRSYFQNSELAASGLPSDAELEILEPLRDQLPEEVFTREYQPPSTDGSGRPRRNLAEAQRILREAGYTVRDNQLYSPDGNAVQFRILLDSPAFERVVLPFSRNLETLGIHADVRRVDRQQYVERIRKFDFDMVVNVFGQSHSPGNEQRDYWHSSSADREDSRNLAGIADPAIDQLVELVINARTREELVTRTRALDRALQWGYYVVPNWHVDYYRIARRHTLARPEVSPPYGITFDTWWHKNAE